MDDDTGNNYLLLDDDDAENNDVSSSAAMTYTIRDKRKKRKSKRRDGVTSGGSSSKRRRKKSSVIKSGVHLCFQELGESYRLYQHSKTTTQRYHNSNDDNNSSSDIYPTTPDVIPTPPWAAIGDFSCLGQTSSDLAAAMIHTSTLRHYRAQARWYYPTDFPFLLSDLEVKRHTLVQEKIQDEKKEQEKRQKRRKGNKQDTTTTTTRTTTREAEEETSTDPKAKSTTTTCTDPKTTAAATNSTHPTTKAKTKTAKETTTKNAANQRYNRVGKHMLPENVILEKKSGRYEKRPELALLARSWNVKDPILSYDVNFLKSNVLTCTDHARALMLLPVNHFEHSIEDGDLVDDFLVCAEDSNDLDNFIKWANPKTFVTTITSHGAVQETKNKTLSVPSLKARQLEYRNDVLTGYRKYDTAYLPAQWKLSRIGRGSFEEPTLYINQERLKHSRFFAQQRLNLADPAYMSPFPIEVLENVLESDMFSAGKRQPTKKMAPAWAAVEAAAAGDKVDHTNDDWLYDEREKKLGFNRRPRDPPQTHSSSNTAANDAGPNNPKVYGNCLICLPCPCPACSTTGTRTDQKDGAGTRAEPGADDRSHNWFLLHPVGDCLDTIAASTLKAPKGLDIRTFLNTSGNIYRQSESGRKLVRYNELPVGDTIRQILQCGSRDSTVFLARTSIHVTLFSVVPHKHDSIFPPHYLKRYATSIDVSTNKSEQSTPLCWGAFILTELQRIDLRAFSRNVPCFYPIHMASHPKFSGSLMASYQYKFAILSHPRQGQEQNTIHHFLWSNGPHDDGAKKRCRVTKHVITNLRAISEIAFSVHHPMILWAVASSYVQPTLTPDRHLAVFHTQPRLGRGYSLYTIDLRKNEATFQWSPSAEDFLSEGIHSISGIALKWDENSLWISSISAGKVWELDGKHTPLRVVNIWTLPSQCDDCGTNLPVLNGLYGAGSMMAFPSFSRHASSQEISSGSSSNVPLFCVSKSHNTFGVQMYQRPLSGARFQTDSLECASSPALASLVGKKHSIAMSSMFPLPTKMTRGVFTCGLAPIFLPVTDLINIDKSGLEVESSTSAIVCMIVMASNGDLFVKNLLGSTHEIETTIENSTPLKGFPLGRRSVSLSRSEPFTTGDNVKEMEKKLGGGLNLYLRVESGKSHNKTGVAVPKSNENRFVRPFRYTDLLQCAVRQDSGQEETPDDAHVFRPTITDYDIGVCRPDENLTSQSLDLSFDSSNNVRNQVEEGLMPSNLCFDNVQRSRVGAGLISDLTSDVFDSAEKEWTRLAADASNETSKSRRSSSGGSEL